MDLIAPPLINIKQTRSMRFDIITPQYWCQMTLLMRAFKGCVICYNTTFHTFVVMTEIILTICKKGEYVCGIIIFSLFIILSSLKNFLKLYLFFCIKIIYICEYYNYTFENFDKQVFLSLVKFWTFNGKGKT